MTLARAAGSWSTSAQRRGKLQCGRISGQLGEFATISLTHRKGRINFFACPCHWMSTVFVEWLWPAESSCPFGMCFTALAILERMGESVRPSAPSAFTCHRLDRSSPSSALSPSLQTRKRAMELAQVSWTGPHCLRPEGTEVQRTS